MRAAARVIVVAEKVEILPCGTEGEESRVVSVLGDAVAAWEKEGKGNRWEGYGCGEGEVVFLL